MFLDHPNFSRAVFESEIFRSVHCIELGKYLV